MGDSVLIGQPLLVALVFLVIAIGGAWAARRLSRRSGGKGRLGAWVFSGSALAMACLFAFVAIFFWITR